MNKRVLIHTNHFYPETFRVNDIAFDLADKGYDVTVITSVPNYPKGVFFDGSGVFKRRKEIVNGVKVIRVPVIPRGNGSGMRLMLNYLSYLVSATITAVYLALTKKYDLIFVHETSPVTVGIPAVLVKKIQKIPLYFWVLDLWPESLEAAGNIRNKSVLNFFAAITKWIYRNSDKILISSRGFNRSICEKGNFADKIIYFPNWSEDTILDAGLKSIPQLPEGFRIMFAGNIGEAQNFENLLKVALALKDRSEIQWIIIGDGRKVNYVSQFVEQHGLQNTFHLLGRYDISYMASFFKQADVMLVSLNDEPVFNATLPAKVQAYMACKKPILAMLNGEGQEVISAAKCGLFADASDIDGMVTQINKLYEMSQSDLVQLGENGYKFYVEHFRKETCMEHLEQIFAQ